VHRMNRVLRVLLPTALLAIAAGAVLPSMAGASDASGPKTITGTFHDGATYLIQVPAKWNGTLFLYSHGYVVPGTSNPAMDAPDSVTGGWMLAHGYALAGSSYSGTGWAVQQALPDQIHTLNVFDTKVGTPAKTIAWGDSLGGMITAGLAQNYPNRFNAALPMCGVLSGAVATWNTALDSEVAFQQLVDPSLQVVNITDPGPNLLSALEAAGKAQKSLAGRARIALAAALADEPGWFTPLSAEPGPTDYSAQEQNQFLWATEVTFPFAFDLRAQLEAEAGGNGSWNTGVNYFQQLLHSADLDEVLALYKKAGLDLWTDLNTLQNAPRISADPTALKYFQKYITYTGNLSMPTLTMHTVGDGLVVPENEQAFSSAVSKKGQSALLRQVFVDRAGHCAFTPAENITAAQTLLNRLRTGKWGTTDLTPASMNTKAAALGSTYNEYSGHATDPAFTAYTPASYLRPANHP
jgi:pimeloyl-ACP methyl ester carboxylesterase